MSSEAYLRRIILIQANLAEEPIILKKEYKKWK